MRLIDLGESILLEYNRDITAKAWGQKLLAAANKDRGYKELLKFLGTSSPQDTNLDDRYINDILSRLEAADPTKNKEYVQALAKLYSAGGLKMEDVGSTLSDYLTKFHKLKQKKIIPSPRNDFMRYNDVGDFMSVVDEYPEPEDNKNVSKGTSEVYYEDQDLRILVPKDRESACYYGKGTKWCTAATNNNMYDYYSKQDQLYIILLKKPTYTGEKYQFHFASRQYMDEKDHRINLFKLADRYPQLRQIFAKQADQYNVVELLTTKEEFDKVIKPALRDAEDDMNQYVIKNHEELIKTINDQLMRGAGREERSVIYESMSELSVLLSMGASSLSSTVIRMVMAHPDLIGNDDALHDVISDEMANWVREEDFFAILEEYYNDEEEGDEDAWMDVAMTIEGEFAIFVLNMINAVVAVKIKQVLQK